MKIKLSEATRKQIDYLVAKCEGMSRLDERVTPKGVRWAGDFFRPSEHWSEGGPIIEREGIATSPDTGLNWWVASIKGGVFVDHGPTPLIAAMRCYVASKLGDEVEIPDELMEANNVNPS